MITDPREVVVDHLRSVIAVGETLERFVAEGWRIEALPVESGTGQLMIGGGMLFPTRDGGDNGIKLNTHQIGVVFYWKNGQAAHGVFDVRELWDEIVYPPLEQLVMWTDADFAMA